MSEKGQKQTSQILMMKNNNKEYEKYFVDKNLFGFSMFLFN